MIGLEPANCRPEGREAARRRGHWWSWRLEKLWIIYWKSRFCHLFLSRFATKSQGNHTDLRWIGFFAYTRWIEKGSGKSAEQEITKYHCPMHPTYISDRPGDCPICGMRLVPIESPKQDPESGNGSEGMVIPENQAADSAKHPSVPGYAAVSIPQERIQTMGITVTEARRMELAPSIRTSAASPMMRPACIMFIPNLMATSRTSM